MGVVVWGKSWKVSVQTKKDGASYREGRPPRYILDWCGKRVRAKYHGCAETKWRMILTYTVTEWMILTYTVTEWMILIHTMTEALALGIIGVVGAPLDILDIAMLSDWMLTCRQES